MGKHIKEKKYSEMKRMSTQRKGLKLMNTHTHTQNHRKRHILLPWIETGEKIVIIKYKMHTKDSMMEIIFKTL